MVYVNVCCDLIDEFSFFGGFCYMKDEKEVLVNVFLVFGIIYDLNDWDEVMWEFVINYIFENGMIGYVII